MNWADVRYGVVVKSTAESGGRGMTLMVVSFTGNSEYVEFLLLAADGPPSAMWPIGEIHRVGPEDFWRFKVVE